MPLFYQILLAFRFRILGSQFAKICLEDITNLAAGNNKYTHGFLSFRY